LGAQGRKIVLSAIAAADMLSVPHHHIVQAIESLQPFSGRMQILPGIKRSTLIDDTYNATPAATEAALQVLNEAKSSQRIAILGSMNELGDYAVEAHKSIGASLDPKKLSLVVTIGVLARDYIAPAAQENGCDVHSFLNPQKAGEFVKGKLEEKAVVLCKGSQNGVFSEEALKPLLADKVDQTKLVRQSEYWMKRKQTLLAK
jgi:UDP-N-acetylmuramoyl-tripeptide--D-alanyl-D-alanine ligase